MVKLSFTGHAADEMNNRPLINIKKGITNPVGENPDHKWGLLRESWSGAIVGEPYPRSAPPLSGHVVGLERPGDSFQKGTTTDGEGGTMDVGLGIRADRRLQDSNSCEILVWGSNDDSWGNNDNVARGRDREKDEDNVAHGRDREMEMDNVAHGRDHEGKRRNGNKISGIW